MTNHLEREGLSRAFLQLARSERSAAREANPANDVSTPDAASTSSPLRFASPRCAVCGGPSVAGAGCEFCPKVLP